MVDAVLAPLLTKRRDAWLRELQELMFGLQEKVKGFEPASLPGDESFGTAVAGARLAEGKAFNDQYSHTSLIATLREQ